MPSFSEDENPHPETANVVSISDISKKVEERVETAQMTLRDGILLRVAWSHLREPGEPLYDNLEMAKEIATEKDWAEYETTATEIFQYIKIELRML